MSMNKIAPHLAPALMSNLEEYIQAIVDARLEAAGLLRPRMGLRALRISRGMEIQAVAQISGVSAATISRLEVGKTENPSPNALNKIARALGVSESECRQAFIATPRARAQPKRKRKVSRAKRKNAKRLERIQGELEAVIFKGERECRS